MAAARVWRESIDRTEGLKSLKSIERTERQLGFVWKSEEFETLI